MRVPPFPGRPRALGRAGLKGRQLTRSGLTRNVRRLAAAQTGWSTDPFIPARPVAGKQPGRWGADGDPTHGA
ncbi:hypothetical protein NLS1_25860 [Nocardioides sp. LS1]|nr:hypothetical protein NLS1_25860 [Nocardioides sp. LS1]